MKIIRNNSGMALLNVVIFFLILVLLLGGVMFSSIINQQSSLTNSKHTTAFYTAESAILEPKIEFEKKFLSAKNEDWSLLRLKEELSALMTYFNNVGVITFSNSLNNSNTALIRIEDNLTDSNYPGYVFYRITSVGTVDDVSRSVYVDFGFKYQEQVGVGEAFLGAVVTKGSISSNNNNSIIKGPIASNLENNSNITLGRNSCLNVDLISIPVGENDYTKCNNNPDQEIEELSTPIVFSSIKMPDVVSLKTTGITGKSFSGSTLDLKKKSSDPIREYGKRVYILDTFALNLTNITINIDGVDEKEPIIVIVEGDFNLPKNIKINGLGRLVLILKYSKNIVLDSTIRYGSIIDPSKLSLVLLKQQNDQFNLSIGGASFSGSILTDSYNSLNFGSKFNGYLVTNASSINIQTPAAGGGTTQNGIWVYAPNADFSMQANAVIYGSIMANSFYIQSGNSRIEYILSQPIYPFDEWTPLPYTQDISENDVDVDYVFKPTKEN